MTRRSMGLLFVVFCAPLVVIGDSHAQKKPRKYSNLREALEASKNARDEASEKEALDEVADSEPETRDDVVAIYDAIKDEEKKADSKGDKKAERRILKIAKPLKRCADKKHHAVVAELLDKEAGDLPRNFTPILGHGGAQQNEKETIRLARVSMLMEVAGKGKNKDALPALRKILDKGGITGDLASSAISQVGDPQDLEDFVQRVKKNPKAQLDFSGFGAPGIERIMREVDSSQLSENVSGSLIVRIGRISGPGATQKLRELLKHKDKRVVETASLALSRNMTKDDIGPIQEMLKDPNPEARFQGLVALNEKAWSEDKAPMLIDLLKNDPDAGVRSQAAAILGRRNVKSAEPALREALNDRSRRVQSAADGALKWLSGEYQKQIEKSAEDAKRSK